MSELKKLPNIGTELEIQLLLVGITSPEELKSTGAKAAWRKILAIDPSACFNRLCGLEGAIEGIRWHQLSPEKKQELKEYYTQETKDMPRRFAKRK